MSRRGLLDDSHPRRFSMTDDDPSAKNLHYKPSPHEHRKSLLGDVDETFGPDRDVHSGVRVLYNGQMFCGIIDRLAQNARDNPVRAGLIEVTGNSYNRGYDLVLPFLFKPGWSGWWASKNEKNSYLVFDFKDHKIRIDGYAIKTYHASNEWRHLKSWVLEGSNGDGWQTLHRVKRSGALNDSHATAYFRVKTQGTFKLIRLRMKGKNFYGDNHLFITGIEFFGSYI